MARDSKSGRNKVRTTRRVLRATSHQPRATCIRVRFAVKAGVSAAWVRRVVSAALRKERAAKYSISVYLVGDAEMRRINKKHLKHDYATDVISFGFEGARLAPTEKGQLGELVVSVGTARRLGRELGLPYRQELARYLVHGTLHLLGYDDKRPAARRRMHAKQEDIVMRDLRAIAR